MAKTLFDNLDDAARNRALAPYPITIKRDRRGFDDAAMALKQHLDVRRQNDLRQVDIAKIAGPDAGAVGKMQKRHRQQENQGRSKRRHQVKTMRDAILRLHVSPVLRLAGLKRRSHGPDTWPNAHNYNLWLQYS